MLSNLLVSSVGKNHSNTRLLADLSDMIGQERRFLDIFSQHCLCLFTKFFLGKNDLIGVGSHDFNLHSIQSSRNIGHRTNMIIIYNSAQFDQHVSAKLDLNYVSAKLPCISDLTYMLKLFF